MKTSTFELSNRTVKELKYNVDDLMDIKRAEKQKTRLENDGFNLKFTNLGFHSCTMGYVKFNKGA